MNKQLPKFSAPLSEASFQKFKEALNGVHSHPTPPPPLYHRGLTIVCNFCTPQIIKNDPVGTLWLPSWRKSGATPILPSLGRGEHEWHHGQTLFCTFRVLRHSCSLLWLLSLFSTLWSFLWTGFSLWLHTTKKRMQSQQTRIILFWPSENKIMYNLY